MNEKTKEIFAAPWTDASYVVEDMSYFDINDAHGQCMCSVWTQYFTSEKKPGIDEDAAEKTMNRILHPPELYDALVEAAAGKCWSCAGESSETMLDKPCPKGHDEDCYVAKWRQVLKKVRDGEK